MASYYFLTVWRIQAPIEKVWEAIRRPTDWPAWWKSVRTVRELEKGDPIGVGSLHEYRWRGALPYDLRFTVRTVQARPPVLLEGEARGDLEGSGRWDLSPIDGGTQIRYTWSVRTSQAWMNWLAPLLGPLFRWNHDRVMKEGGRGLAGHLGARLLPPEN